MTTQPRQPLHWAADLVLALFTGALVAAVLVAGVLWAALTEFGLIAPYVPEDSHWQGVPLSFEAYAFLGVMCCVCAAAAFGFGRRRAWFSVAVHGALCALVAGVLLMMASTSYRGASPQETRPDPASTRSGHMCRSGGDSSECPGG
ncbi:hypothetical protein ACFXKW_34505 [Streptomyces sp. NPDC059193]|uniref:hypothetical protein n=1 Tax=Streptomyces sp. NPDC059193 TaxID=3346763 RepID=UPI0036997F3F